MKKLFFILILIQLGNLASSQGLFYELQQLSQINQLPCYREGVVKQFSSYDRTGGNDDGFSGKYSFIRMEGNNRVIAEMKGPGVINRIWTPTPSNDTIEFYFDGETKPRLSLPFIHLFTSNKFPFLNPVCGYEVGGYYCYLPIPYSKSCKVIIKGNILFYQLQYRTYSKDKSIRSFSFEWDENEMAALEKVVNIWSAYGTNWLHELYSDFKVKTTEVKISTGNKKPVFEMKKGGRIIGLEVEGINRLSRDDNRLILRAKWDNEEVYAIDVPLKDFFGYYFGEKSMRSLIGGSSDNISYCYYPMPFSQNALVEITLSESGEPTFSNPELLVRVFYQEKPKEKNEGRFYVYWHRDKNPEIGQPYVIMPKISGRGHYAGTILNCQGHETGSTWYFEGDDVAMVDDELCIHGTGSEDYFNGGYYEINDRWDMPYSLPSHGCLGYSSPLGRTGAFRHYFADKLSFNQNFSMSIEHGPEGNKVPVDYRSLASYYADKAKLQSTPSTGMKEYPVVNLIKYHVTQLKVIAFRNGMLISEKKKNLDRNRVLILKPSASQATMVVQFELSVPTDGKYNLYCSYFREPSTGEIKIMQRQVPLLDWKNLSSEKEIFIEREFIGLVNVNNGICPVTINARGDENTRFILSQLILEKL